jgi:hypothetical protein
MTPTRADASAALHEVEQAENRSNLLRGYQIASPHLIIWGVIWAVGYTLSYLMPPWTNIVWLTVVPLGVAGDILVSRGSASGGKRAVAMLQLGTIFMVLFGGTIAVMQPHDPRQIAAFVPLLVAAGYGIIGVLGSPRMLIIASLVAALTLVGFFAVGAMFLPWMAVVGGGGLVIGGLWLRQA